jgi:hypothetical protein
MNVRTTVTRKELQEFDKLQPKGNDMS